MEIPLKYLIQNSYGKVFDVYGDTIFMKESLLMFYGKNSYGNVFQFLWHQNFMEKSLLVFTPRILTEKSL